MIRNVEPAVFLRRRFVFVKIPGLRREPFRFDLREHEEQIDEQEDPDCRKGEEEDSDQDQLSADLVLTGGRGIARCARGRSLRRCVLGGVGFGGDRFGGRFCL